MISKEVFEPNPPFDAEVWKSIGITGDPEPYKFPEYTDEDKAKLKRVLAEIFGWNTLS